jgi:hypothetical protein
MKSSVFWDKTNFSLLKVKLRFGRTHPFCLQIFVVTCFTLGLTFDLEYGGDTLL